MVGGCLPAHFQATFFHLDVLSECLYIDEYQENDAEATRLQDQHTTVLYCLDYNKISLARVLEEDPLMLTVEHAHREGRIGGVLYSSSCIVPLETTNAFLVGS